MHWELKARALYSLSANMLPYNTAVIHLINVNIPLSPLFSNMLTYDISGSQGNDDDCVVLSCNAM